MESLGKEKKSADDRFCQLSKTLDVIQREREQCKQLVLEAKEKDREDAQVGGGFTVYISVM